MIGKSLETGFRALPEENKMAWHTILEGKKHTPRDRKVPTQRFTLDSNMRITKATSKYSMIHKQPDIADDSFLFWCRQYHKLFCQRECSKRKRWLFLLVPGT